MEVREDTSRVREALRELRGKQEIARAAQTPQEAREHLEGFVIHPAFFDDPASDLAAEYLQDVLHVDPLENVTLWALYTEAACRVLNRPDAVPSPFYGTNGSA